MKATELMIGDWVHSEFSAKPVQLKEIKVDDEFFYGWVKTTGVEGWKSDLSLSEIPLTIEILGDNGFEIHFGAYFCNEDESRVLEISEWRGDLYWSVAGREYNLTKLTYVHELQHALKLCGIDKQITL